MKPSELLRAAKKLIETPANFTSEVFAKTRTGATVQPGSSKAEIFSLDGALFRAWEDAEEYISVYHEAEEYLRRIANRLGVRYADFIEDHAATMRLLNEAVALAESEER